ncbi:hypothetical protein HJFPF1_11900 [Paramyrothecium foliicola]|nr:hypothetical protein HJFPF1_11900 [Paramyrothecium foliicola]
MICILVPPPSCYRRATSTPDSGLPPPSLTLCKPLLGAALSFCDPTHLSKVPDLALTSSTWPTDSHQQLIKVWKLFNCYERGLIVNCIQSKNCFRHWFAPHFGGCDSRRPCATCTSTCDIDHCAIVGQPAPGAPEAEAAAPTVPTIDKPDETKPADSAPETSKLDVPDGAGPKVGLPKPVEVMSVPETPVNGNTPAGGTPRPVLNTFEEPTSAPAKEEPSVITGVQEPVPTPVESKPESGATVVEAADAPVAAVNGNADPKPDVEMTGAIQTEPETDPADEAAKTAAEETLAGDKKRKLETDEPSVTTTTTTANTETSDATANGGAEALNGASEEPSEKKVKTNAGEAATATSPNGKAAKKDKKPAPAVGKTARKTRSQGPVEV